MPDDPQQPSGGEKPPPETPSFVTRDDLTRFAETVLSRVQGLVEGTLSASQASTPPAPAAPAAPAYDLAEIDQMVRDGSAGSAEKIAHLVDAKVAERIGQFRQNELDPTVRDGFGNLEVLAKDMALRDVPPEHRKRFEKEIDTFVAAMDPKFRGNPEAYRQAYAHSLGIHHQELVREETERVLRTAAERPAVPLGGSGGYLDEERKTPLPSVEEFAGAEGLQALREKGITDPSEWAKRAGYKDWRDFVKSATEFDPSRQNLADDPHQMYPNSPRGARRHAGH